MDESEMAEMLEQKRENPRLKRPPLELGTKFTNYSDHQNIVQLESPLNHTEILLLLFGAEWCNITKSFVNKVKSHYKEINLEQKNVEIIYVSLDKSEKDYDMFTQKFPWLGIKFDDPRVKSLREFYNVKAIPSLILLDDKGEEIGSCREDVYHLSEDDAYSKWKKRKESTQPLMKVESEQDIE